MRSKKIVLTSHCVLNQNAVLNGWERARGAFPAARLLVESGMGIIQLPCPELLYGGIDRPPLSYEDYDKKDYRELCQRLLSPIMEQLLEYRRNGYAIAGVIGINNSPTCSVSGKRGVLMEALFSLCDAEGIRLNYIEIPEDYNEASNSSEMDDKILKFINQNSGVKLL